jgi:hypothetical protein
VVVVFIKYDNVRQDMMKQKRNDEIVETGKRRVREY